MKFLRKALKRHGRPEALVTDRLRTYGAALKALGRGDDREMGRWVNNRAENSHQPFRRRERAMLRFSADAKPAEVRLGPCRRCTTTSTTSALSSSRSGYKASRDAALEEWRSLLAA